VRLWFAGEFGDKISSYDVAVTSASSSRRLGAIDDYVDELVPGTAAAVGFHGV
jgi:hypothetical protein